MANYKNLLAWQKSHALAIAVYKVTEKFPRQELFGLRSQIRRSALSIPTNIVEGYNRKSKKEFTHFIDIALGSLAETEYLIEFAKELNYLNEDDEANIRSLIVEAGKLLWGLQRSKLQP
ncbi:MAG: four helix bundle protein [Candidatus Edwardsbacteria bacterium]